MSARSLCSLACFLVACAGAPSIKSIVGVPHCSTLMLGRKTDNWIQLPPKTTGSHDYVYFPNNCLLTLHTKLVGEEVTACDTVGQWPPTIMPFGIGSFSPLYVNCAPENPHPCYELLTVTAMQYCEANQDISNHIEERSVRSNNDYYKYDVDTEA